MVSYGMSILTICFNNSFDLSPALIEFPVTKKVPFILYLSKIFKTSGVLVVDGPSSKVKYAIFLPSFLTGYCNVPFKRPLVYSDTTFPSSAFGSLSKGKYSNSFVFDLSLLSVYFFPQLCP